MVLESGRSRLDPLVESVIAALLVQAWVVVPKL